MTGDGPKFVFLTIWDHFEPFLPSINSMLLVSCQNSTLKLTQQNCPGLCTMGIAYNAINAACIIGTVLVSEGLDEVFEFVEHKLET